MELNRKIKFQLQLHHWVFVVLLLLLAGLLGAASRIYHKSWDVTFNARNSLSAGSIELLGKLKEPISVTVYASAASETGKAAADFLTPYQRAKPNIKLAFIDPAEQPMLARQAGIQREGEMIVQVGKRTEHLANYNESAFSNLLTRLARDKERLVLYLDGHGERKLDGAANHDLGDFGVQLASRGFKSAPLNLSLAQEVPHNASVLVIAGPRVDLLPAEVEKLKQFIKRGGNLLWLADQEPLHGLQPLVEQFGIALTPGAVIDPQAQEMKVAATFAIGAAYGQHPLFANFNVITVFPFAREVVAQDTERGWRATPLIQVAARGWLETGKLDNSVAFDKSKDKPGPITIAVALERSVESREQRVAVIGNGHFLANQYLGNAGNLDLGINLINWLAGDENLIAIRPRATKDAQVELSQSATLFIVIGFLIVLPLAFLVAGGWVWWRRRKP
ncbi:MAG: GldG family protein [Hydrogenophilales bacterium]|nr:GldG family protein [Hydrogenophilales bacterium]